MPKHTAYHACAVGNKVPADVRVAHIYTSSLKIDQVGGGHSITGMALVTALIPFHGHDINVINVMALLMA